MPSAVTVNVPLESLGINWECLWNETGNRGYVPDGESLRLLDGIVGDIGRICRPVYSYGIFDCTGVSDDTVGIEGRVFSTGERIAGYLAEAERIAVYVSTAGVEFEAYCRSLATDGDVARSFFADLAGTVIADAISRKAYSDIAAGQEKLGFRTGNTYCPGQCGWPVSDQKLLFSLFPPEPCGVCLTESGLMVPIKSVSAIAGVGRNIRKRPRACATCTLETCYKKAEYRTSHQ